MKRMNLFTALAMAASICASGVVVQAGRPAEAPAASTATNVTDDQDSTPASQGPGTVLQDIRENEQLRRQRLFSSPTRAPDAPPAPR